MQGESSLNSLASSLQKEISPASENRWTKIGRQELFKKPLQILGMELHVLANRNSLDKMENV
jgi:hypothetical protein